VRETLLAYCEADRQIHQGDLLLWKAGWNPASFLIGVFGRAGVSHAAMVALPAVLGPGFARNCWDVLEVLQWYGGRRRTLEGYVNDEPGRIMWFAANPRNRWPEWQPRLAVRAFGKLVGCKYGWLNILKVGLLHFPLARFLTLGLLRQATDDRAGEGPAPFCSQAVAIAARAGGVDPVPHLADNCTEPADLARSLFYEYRATLVPDWMLEKGESA